MIYLHTRPHYRYKRSFDSAKHLDFAILLLAWRNLQARRNRDEQHHEEQLEKLRRSEYQQIIGEASHWTSGGWTPPRLKLSARIHWWCPVNAARPTNPSPTKMIRLFNIILFVRMIYSTKDIQIKETSQYDESI